MCVFFFPDSLLSFRRTNKTYPTSVASCSYQNTTRVPCHQQVSTHLSQPQPCNDDDCGGLGGDDDDGDDLSTSSSCDSFNSCCSSNSNGDGDEPAQFASAAAAAAAVAVDASRSSYLDTVSAFEAVDFPMQFNFGSAYGGNVTVLFND